MLYKQKLELTTANFTKEAIQKQLYNEFKTTARPTNSHYKLRAALKLYDLFHICENVLQNPILQPLKIQYIGKLTELKFQQFSDQISSIILDYYLEITDSTWTLMELSLEEEHKIKGHSGVSRNKYVDLIAGAVSLSGQHLISHLNEYFIVADNNVVSGNSRHFVYDIYHSICHACWEVGSGSKFLTNSLLSKVDWPHSLLVWHPNLHMTTSFTSKLSAGIHTYFMKALHYWLPVAVQKRLYNRHYPGVLCLYCGEVETSDHLLSFCVSDFSVFMALYKSFVFNDWFREAVSVFHNPKVAGLKVVKFVRSLAYMEKANLILLDGSVLVTVSDLTLGFSAGVVKLLGITEVLGVHFGFHKSCLFFLDINDSVSVHITV
ncbi:hypothetical protein G9A89_002722 [Geosiphon pyriformis]|nr:hypothetical protein G9A89_002722 [Geosiphon pyriformis]